MKKNKLFKVGMVLAMGTLLTGCASGTGASKSASNSKGKVKNVIFMIGDGMGNSYTSGYRYYKANGGERFVSQTEFDKYLVGQQATYPEDPKSNVTDSASAATAMAAGVKTYNNAIGLDNDLSDTESVLERAKKKGKSTGLVATSEITHATPAGYGAHEATRKSMDRIADDYFDEKIDGKHKIDVLLGGGSKLFERDERNLVKEFEKDGYSHVTDKKSLEADSRDQILGLFATGGLPKMIDRTDETPSLADMTDAAIKRLDKNKDGFFLMVEGSQIDWAGHSNDIVGAMSEMEDFEAAFKKAVEFAEKDGETIVIATADHSTGGLSIAADDVYNWDTKPIHQAKRTPDFMAEEILEKGDVKKTLKDYIEFDLTDEEIASVEKTVKDAQELNKTNNEKAVDAVAIPIRKIFDVHSNTGWTTKGHTGEDVNVYAFGPQSDLFKGQIENTDQAKLIFGLIEGTNKKEDVKDVEKK